MRTRTQRVDVSEKPEDGGVALLNYQYRAQPSLAIKISGGRAISLPCSNVTVDGQTMSVGIPAWSVAVGSEVTAKVEVSETMEGSRGDCTHVDGAVQMYSRLGIDEAHENLLGMESASTEYKEFVRKLEASLGGITCNPSQAPDCVDKLTRCSSATDTTCLLTTQHAEAEGLLNFDYDYQCTATTVLTLIEPTHIHIFVAILQPCCASLYVPATSHISAKQHRHMFSHKMYVCTLWQNVHAGKLYHGSLVSGYEPVVTDAADQAEDITSTCTHRGWAATQSR